MMKNTELLYGKDGATRLDDIAGPLARAYKNAFAGKPWYEASRCDNETCRQEFSGCAPGEACAECGVKLGEAYKTEELAAGWREMLENENALMEIGYQEGDPVRATIARPTTPSELFERKYSDVPEMKPWLQENFASELVWIEDTFADRKKSPARNLDGRSQTLGAISLRYSSLAIVTRTLAPAIVRATLRDVGDKTKLFIGSENVGAEMSGAVAIGNVPDRRTLLNVELR